MATSEAVQGRSTPLALVTATLAACGLIAATPATAAIENERPAISITHTTERSTALSPGHIVRFNVSIEQEDTAVADDITVRIDYDQSVFTSVEVEAPTTEVVDSDGAIIWNVESLSADGTATLTYRATAASAFPASAIAVENEASVFVGESNISSAVVTLPLAAQLAVSESPRPVTELQASDLVDMLRILVGAAFVIVLLVTGFTGFKFVRQPDVSFDDWRSSMTVVLDLLAVVVIVGAVLILAIRGSIGEDGTISILAGIAGYVLGRAVRTTSSGESRA